MALRDMYLRALLARHEVVLLPLAAGEGRTRGAPAPLPPIFQRLALRPAGATPLSQAGTGGAAEDRWALERGLAGIDRSVDELVSPPLPAQPDVTVDGAEEALSRSPGRRMVVLGGPGTGKTTLLRALVSRAARRALEEGTAPLPVMVDLPDLAEHGADLRRYLPRLSASLGFPGETAAELAAALSAAIDEGTALVCLDGLDEVAPAKRGALLSWLVSLRGVAGAWAVGSRFTSYRSGDLGQGGFTEWELLPLDEAAQRQLSDLLLSRLAAADAPRSARDADAFLAALSQHPHVATWKGVPLLLSLAASAWAQRGALPASRAALYQRATDTLLAARSPEPEAQRALRGALAQVGLSLFRQGEHTSSRERLREAVDALPEVKRAARAGRGALAERLIGSGLIDTAGDALRFAHQTLHEYLVAVALAQDLAAGGTAADRALALAWSKRTFSRWSEPLRLMVGVLVHELAEPGAAAALEWLRALAAVVTTEGRTAGGDPGDLVLSLAVCSLAELPEPPASWQAVEPIGALLGRWAARAIEAPIWRAGTPACRLAAEVARLWPTAREQAAAPLCAALASDPDAQRRAAAARALSELGAAAPMEPLVRALGDRSADVRQVAAAALRQHAKRCPPEPLLAAMRDDDPETRRRAARTLGALGERAPIERLGELLEDPEPEVRRTAIEALGALGERAPIAALVRATRDTDTGVRVLSAEALGQLGERAAHDEAAVDALFTLLSGDRGEPRGAAAAALRALREHVPLARWMRVLPAAHQDDEQGIEIVKAYCWLLADLGLGERAPFDVLLQHLSSERESAAAEAVLILGELARWVPIPPLVEVLRTGSAAAKQRALEVLRRTGARAPIAEIAALLSGQPREVRAQAARALGLLESLGDQAPVGDLIQAATADEAPDVRMWALLALARLGPRAPVPVLLEALVRQGELIFPDMLPIVVAGIARAGGELPLDALASIAHAWRAYHPDELSPPRCVHQAYNAASRCTRAATLLAAMASEEEPLRRFAATALAWKIRRGDAEGTVEALVARMEQPGAMEEPFQEAMSLLFTMYPGQPPEAWLRRELGKTTAVAREMLTRAAVQIAAFAGEVACAPHALSLVRSGDGDTQALGMRCIGALLARPALPAELRASLFAALLPFLDGDATPASAVAARAAGRAGEAPPEVLAALWRVAARSPATTWACRQEERVAAAAALRALGAPPDIDVLLRLLGDPDPTTEQVIPPWLGSLGGAAPVEALVERLRAVTAPESGDGSEERAQRAERAATRAALSLGLLGERAPLAPLLEALGGACWALREAAARALGRLGERVPLGPLIAQLASERVDVRRFAALALQGRREPEAIAALTRALGDVHPDVRGGAARALEVTGQDEPSLLPVRALLDAGRDGRDERSVTARAAAAAALGALGAKAPRAPLEALLGDEVHSPVRDAVFGEALEDSAGWREAVIARALRGHREREYLVLRLAARALAGLPIDRDWPPDDLADLVATDLAQELGGMALAAVRRWLSESASPGGRLGAREPAGAPALPPGEFLEAARRLAVDSSAPLRHAGLCLLAAHAPAELGELAEDALRVLAGGAPRGPLSELARCCELQAMLELPCLPAEAWDLAIEALLGSPLPGVRARAVRVMASTRSAMPERAFAALTSRRADPSAAVRDAVERALASVLSREGAQEDDEA
ncbi:HEAT repeat domain-containing protein [Sorangium sp. So ce1097]|uniref:HEAT repeat domain-containing protein n=1 Tax=Sorangium sp. So ce1097 TaxID=3133330 RepID=UPI003F5DCE02